MKISRGLDVKVPVMVQEKYRTFWRRFWASFIDALIYIPIGLINIWFFAQGFSGWVNLIYYALVSCLLIYAYSIFMHGRYGQTVGKMITGVKLLALNEEPLGYKRALLRDAIPVLFIILLILYEAPIILQGISPDDIQADYNMLFFNILSVANTAWFVAELVTMLTNKKRRALHDFIAGSVVVRL